MIYREEILTTYRELFFLMNEKALCNATKKIRDIGVVSSELAISHQGWQIIVKIGNGLKKIATYLVTNLKRLATYRED